MSINYEIDDLEEYDEVDSSEDSNQESPIDDIDLDDDLGDFDLGEGDRVVPMEKHNDLLKGLTKFAPFIKILYNNWLGIVWNEEQKKFMRDPNLPQIMNKIGANWHASFIQTYVRDNNILAHLNRDEYYDILEDVNKTLLLTYAKRYEEFGFSCYSDVIRVWNEVENASLLALSGAGGGKYSDFLGGGIVQYRGQFQEHNTNQPGMQMPPGYVMPKRPGMFGKIMGKLVGTGKPPAQQYKQGGY